MSSTIGSPVARGHGERQVRVAGGERRGGDGAAPERAGEREHRLGQQLDAADRRGELPGLDIRAHRARRHRAQVAERQRGGVGIRLGGDRIDVLGHLQRAVLEPLDEHRRRVVALVEQRHDAIRAGAGGEVLEGRERDGEAAHGSQCAAPAGDGKRVGPARVPVRRHSTTRSRPTAACAPSPAWCSTRSPRPACASAAPPCGPRSTRSASASRRSTATTPGTSTRSRASSRPPTGSRSPPASPSACGRSTRSSPTYTPSSGSSRPASSRGG